MRILGGVLGGRTMPPLPRGVRTRPVTSRIRESLFSVFDSLLTRVGAGFEDVVFLDLFCGSGVMGMEALSRGARMCCFVDLEPRMLSYVKKTAAGFGMEPRRVAVFRYKARRFLLSRAFVLCSDALSIAFADPPFSVVDRASVLELREAAAAAGVSLFAVRCPARLGVGPDGFARVLRYGEDEVFVAGPLVENRGGGRRG